MCTTGIGTCTNPKELGALNNYNDQVPGSTSSLSSIVPDYIFKLGQFGDPKPIKRKVLYSLTVKLLNR